MPTTASRQTHCPALTLSILLPEPRAQARRQRGFGPPLRRAGLTSPVSRGLPTRECAAGDRVRTCGVPASPRPRVLPQPLPAGRVGPGEAELCHVTAHSGPSTSAGALRPECGHGAASTETSGQGLWPPAKTDTWSMWKLTGGIQVTHRSFPRRGRWQNTGHRPGPDSGTALGNDPNQAVRAIETGCLKFKFRVSAQFTALERVGFVPLPQQSPSPWTVRRLPPLFPGQSTHGLACHAF